MIGMPPPTLASYRMSTPFFAGQRQQLGAVLGHDLLVGGDHVTAGLKRPLCVLVGGVLPTQQLDDDVHIGLSEERLGVGGDEGRVEGERPRLGGVFLQDTAQKEGTPYLLGEDVGLFGEDAGHTAADDAQPHEAYLHLASTVAHR